MNHALLKALCIVATVFLLQSCGPGGCNRTPGAQPADDVDITAQRQNPEMILATPVQFEAQSIDEALRMVESDRELTRAESAQCIVVAEAGVGYLAHVMYGLKNNDDYADTWNVFNELSRETWPGQTLRVVEGLEVRKLDDSQQLRVQQMRQDLNQTLDFVRKMQKENPGIAIIFPETTQR